MRHAGPSTGADLPRVPEPPWEPTVVSGSGTIIGYTVNQHQWHPDFVPPYAIAVVALAEDPEVRLTTNIVGCDPEDVEIGQEVVVRFEHVEEVWFPFSS